MTEGVSDFVLMKQCRARSRDAENLVLPSLAAYHPLLRESPVLNRMMIVAKLPLTT